MLMNRIGPLCLSLLAANAIAHEPMAVVPGDADAIPFPGHVTWLLSDADATPSGAAILTLEVPARSVGAPPHVHAREDEQFYVLEGQVEFLERERTVRAGAGTLVVLPRGHLHGFWNPADRPARLLLIVTPGKFASFFDQVVATLRAEHADEPEAVGAIIARVAEDYGVTVHPEKLPEAARALLSGE